MERAVAGNHRDLSFVDADASVSERLAIGALVVSTAAALAAKKALTSLGASSSG